MKKWISVPDVIALVMDGRRCADPNAGFREQLKQYHSILECQLIKTSQSEPVNTKHHDIANKSVSAKIDYLF
jgi:hypothetical protein